MLLDNTINTRSRCRSGVLAMAFSACTAVAMAASFVSLDASHAGRPDGAVEGNAIMGEMVTVSGVVLTPDGKPLDGATVRANTPDSIDLRWILGKGKRDAQVEVKTDTNGRFTISYNKQPFGDLSQLSRRWHGAGRFTNIVAFARGFGPVWVPSKELELGKPLTLKLVKDLPVKGRVVDAAGRPIAGVTVRKVILWAANDEDASPWLKAVKESGSWADTFFYPKWIRPEAAGLETKIVTDENGQFEIHGVGRERRLELIFMGAGVAQKRVKVVTRPMETVHSFVPPESSRISRPVFGAEFTFTAAPARVVEGTIRDAKTGEPLAGVTLKPARFASSHRVLETITDERGHFRLVGMPKADRNHLLILPNNDQPYFTHKVEVPNPAGLGPVNVDIELNRGIWITGRVTNKATGDPIRSLLSYCPLRTNEFARSIPEFGDNYYSLPRNKGRNYTKADGTFRLVGLPGRAIVCTQSVMGNYRQGVGAEQIKVTKSLETGNILIYAGQVSPSYGANVLHEINPPVDAKSASVNFEMDPGLSVRIKMVDPTGKPIQGARVTGANPLDSWKTAEDSSIEVLNLGPNEERTVVLYHEQRKLGWVARVRGNGDTQRTITVKLQPFATVTGKLLHNNGTPCSGSRVWAKLSEGNNGQNLPGTLTDSEGKFRYSIVPGFTYRLWANGTDKEHGGYIENELILGPSETKDYGAFVLSKR